MLRQKGHAQPDDLSFQSLVHLHFPYFSKWLAYPEETNLHWVHPWRLELFYCHSPNPLVPQLITASGARVRPIN